MATPLAEGLAWPEGPSVLPDGRVAFVETYRSQISVWDPAGGVSRLADTGGGPNATVLGADGALYTTQNGGVVGPWRAERRQPPSIQRVDLDGNVQVLATEIGGVRLQAPNDLAFGRDGRLYFTDPGRFDAEKKPDPGYIFALAPDGSGEIIAQLEPVYPNGITAEPDGSVVWVESYTRLIKRRSLDGSVVTLTEVSRHDAVLDGLKIATDGNLFVTAGRAGIVVISPQGDELEFLAMGTVVTNCAFDGTRLYVTDGGHAGTSPDAKPLGVLWAVELQVAGAEPFRSQIISAKRETV